jgi:hypothetical protein
MLDLFLVWEFPLIIFARWQAILSVFDFDIEYIKGINNFIPDFLTRLFFPTPVLC